MMTEQTNQQTNKLSIRVFSGGFCFWIQDTETNEMLGDRQMVEVAGDGNSFQQAFFEHLQQEPALQAQYASVVVYVESPKWTLVPVPMMDGEHVGIYLKTACQYDEKNEIALIDFLQQSDIYNLFAVSNAFFSQLKTIYPDAKVMHYMSPVIESNGKSVAASKASERVYVNLQKNGFDVLVYHKDALQLATHVNARNEEDFVFHVMNVLQQTKTAAKAHVYVTTTPLVKCAEGYVSALKQFIKRVEVVSL